MEMSPAEITKLAVDRYTGEGYEGISDCLFALLVDVADTSIQRQENGPGADSPAPFLGGTTPIEAALASLAENIELRRATSDV